MGNWKIKLLIKFTNLVLEPNLKNTWQAIPFLPIPVFFLNLLLDCLRIKRIKCIVELALRIQKLIITEIAFTKCLSQTRNIL